jgi:Zn finger protein HypA/HybF involved in hydrogenase expression
MKPKRIAKPKIILIPPYKIKCIFEKKYAELKSLALVAEFFKINITTASTWKLKHGIETIPKNSEYGLRSRREGKPWADKDKLSKMYDDYSIREISSFWNCDPSTISKWLKIHEIPIKTSEEQWKRKAKMGKRIIIDGAFDFQEYKKAYAERCILSKQALEFIKQLVGECQSCGYAEALDLHHINEDNKDNRPENHAILCPNCHAKIHRLGFTLEQLCYKFKPWNELL